MEHYLIDFENPDAGIGHSLGHINCAIKICQRNGLAFCFSPSQLVKSTADSLKWRLRQGLRKLTFRQVHETHNIGNSLNEMFAFDNESPPREHIERLMRQKKIRVVQLPKPNIVIPSHHQNDSVVYRDIDLAIRENLAGPVVFVLPHKRIGDFEYAETREWFRNCYLNARKTHPINLPGPRQSDSEIRVALHIRRGDLLPGRQFSDLSDRMLPDEWYSKILAGIRECIPKSKTLVVYVVSEGVNGAYFSEMGMRFSWQDHPSCQGIRVIEMIDAPLLDSFNVLFEADILIGSRSGMTHLAGMLSDNIKFVPMMWHSYKGTPGVLELSPDLGQDELQKIYAFASVACS